MTKVANQVQGSSEKERITTKVILLKKSALLLPIWFPEVITCYRHNLVYECMLTILFEIKGFG